MPQDTCDMKMTHAALLRKGRWCPVCNFNRPEEVDDDEIVEFEEEVAPSLLPDGRISAGELDLRSKTTKEAS